MLLLKLLNFIATQISEVIAIIVVFIMVIALGMVCFKPDVFDNSWDHPSQELKALPESPESIVARQARKEKKTKIQIEQQQQEQRMREIDRSIELEKREEAERNRGTYDFMQVRRSLESTGWILKKIVPYGKKYASENEDGVHIFTNYKGRKLRIPVQNGRVKNVHVPSKIKQDIRRDR